MSKKEAPLRAKINQLQKESKLFRAEIKRLNFKLGEVVSAHDDLYMLAHPSKSMVLAVFDMLKGIPDLEITVPGITLFMESVLKVVYPNNEELN